MTRNRITGIFIFVFGLLIYFVLIPYGIKVPKNIAYVTTSPAFWPSIISVVIIIMGALLIIQEKNNITGSDAEIPTPWKTRAPRLLIIALMLFGFYSLIETLGMVVPSIVLIFSLMIFSGHRRWRLMAPLSFFIPIILYTFFVYIANIPIPLGIFEF
jgi:putative tricarboxylic transport membrane protein